MAYNVDIKTGKILVKNGESSVVQVRPETIASQVLFGTTESGVTTYSTTVQKEIDDLKALFGTNDAMVFMGVVNNASDLPTEHTKGWTYKVSTAGTYAGIVCEVGDTIICVAEDGEDTDWAVIQNNIDGAVTIKGGAVSGSVTTGNLAIFDGVTGTVIEDAGISVADAIEDHVVVLGADEDALSFDPSTAPSADSEGKITQTLSLDKQAVIGDFEVDEDYFTFTQIGETEPKWTLGLTEDFVDEINMPAYATVKVGDVELVATENDETIEFAVAGAISANSTSAIKDTTPAKVTFSAPVVTVGSGITSTATSSGFELSTTAVESFASTTTNGVVSVKNFGGDAVEVVVASAMTGADGSNAGVAGFVPAPVATDNVKFLKGNATWGDAVTSVVEGATDGTVAVSVNGGEAVDVAVHNVAVQSDIEEVNSALETHADVLATYSNDANATFGHIQVASGQGLTLTAGVVEHTSGQIEAQDSDFFKFGTDKFGHVSAVTAVEKVDITGLLGEAEPVVVGVGSEGDDGYVAPQEGNDGYMTKEQATALVDNTSRIEALEDLADSSYAFATVSAGTGSIVADQVKDTVIFTGTSDTVDTRITVDVVSDAINVDRTLDTITTTVSAVSASTVALFDNLRIGGMIVALD